MTGKNDITCMYVQMGFNENSTKPQSPKRRDFSEPRRPPTPPKSPPKPPPPPPKKK